MRTTTVVIGAGHAGLAMSHCLTSRSIDHVVLERGEVANSWKTERWDSLRLLTPNWQSRLPGYTYDGADPDGFRTMPETIAFIESYAGTVRGSRSRPTRRSRRSRIADGGYRVTTAQGEWRCRTVVVASGACNIPRVPAVAAALPPGIKTLTPMEYRNPAQVEDGGVLVVGASATGTQLAEELQLVGPARDARGRRAHPRAPRLPRPGHQVVDGRRRRDGRPLRRARRHRPRPRRALAAAGGVDGPQIGRSQPADGARRAPGRSSGGDPRRQGAVLGVVAEPVRAVGPEDEPLARPDRRVGDRERARRRHRSAAPLRAHPASSTRRRSGSISRSGEIRTVHLGHRLPPGLFLARRAGAGSQGPHQARRRRRRGARHVPDGDPVPQAAQVHAHRRRRRRRARS